MYVLNFDIIIYAENLRKLFKKMERKSEMFSITIRSSLT